MKSDQCFPGKKGRIYWVAYISRTQNALLINKSKYFLKVKIHDL